MLESSLGCSVILWIFPWNGHQTYFFFLFYDLDIRNNKAHVKNTREAGVENKHIDVKGEGESGMNWDIWIDMYALTDAMYKIDNLMKTYCIAQGALFSALW